MRTEGFPRVFGPYLLLSSLGRGGMGEVFLGKRHAVGDVDRLCIVKTLRGDLAEHGEYVRRFLDEARIVVQLHHAHICQVFETQAVGAEHCLAMEYIAGVNAKDLALDLTHKGERLDPGIALFLIACVLDALAFAHRFKSPITGAHLRVVHRDVSPANVMIGFDGDVKLIDFGLAESSLKTEHTETRLVMGKVAYMSPEQARGDEVDGSADQFAAGVMLYELLTGDRFYGDMNPHQIWQIVGRGGHVPRRWLDVPEGLRNVIARALDPVSSRRFPSCDEMRDAIDELRARLYPRANKGQLRELMQRLYGDRADAERDLIASFADLRAPVGGLPSGNAPELSITNRVELADAETRPSHAAPGTEPWRNSPGSVDLPAAAGVVGQPLPRATEVTATAQLARRTTGPVEPSDAVVVPTSPVRPVLLAGAVVGALVVVGALLWGGDSPTMDRADAGLARAAADAGTASDAGMVAAHADAPDAGFAAVTGADAGSAPPDAGAAIVRRAPRRDAPAPPPTQPSVTPATRDPAPVPRADPTPTPAPAAPDVLPKRSFDENLRIVRACNNTCAAPVLALVEKNLHKPDAAAVVLENCANKCLQAR